MGAPNPQKFLHEPHKNQFVELKLKIQYFLHQRYLKDKMFDTVLITLLRNFPKWTPQNQLF